MTDRVRELISALCVEIETMSDSEVREIQELILNVRCPKCGGMKKVGSDGHLERCWNCFQV